MVNVRDIFWSMVRDPQLIINYLKELNIDINNQCDYIIKMNLKCPPSINDDFRTRFLVVSYLYLNALNMELQALEGTRGIVINGLRELISDVLSDMRIYNAPPRLMDAVTRIARDLIRKSARSSSFLT